jgi:FkbM family methyltransferase
MNPLIWYLRHIPVDYGKHFIAERVDLSSCPRDVIHTNRWGVQLEVRLDTHLGRTVFLYDVYEKNTIRHLLRRLRPGMTVVDCGASIGDYALVLAKRLQSGRVIAFEPLAASFDILCRNIGLNGLTNVFPEKLGVSDRIGDETVFFGADAPASASLRSGPGEHASESIRVVDLDSYCASHGIQAVDILKVDVEGNELNCIRGAKRIIGASRNLVLAVEFIESHFQRFGYDSGALFDEILRFDFKAYYPQAWPFGLKECRTAPSSSYQDNLIFVRS